MKRILVLSLTLLAAACAPSPKGEAIPLKQLFAENAQLPYECGEYDPETETCEGIAKRTVRGDRVLYDIDLIMPRLPGIPGQARVNMKMGFQIQGTRYCGNFRNANVKVSGVPDSYATDLAIILRAEMSKDGPVCSSYYRDGSDYLSVGTRMDGSRIRGASGKVTFLARPKGLRAPSGF